MQRAARAHTGWAIEERKLMWEEVRRANTEGLTLKHAFDSISRKTGRKPNSIRNYYYQSLREQGAPEELRTLRVRPFVPFSEEEIRQLLRTVLTERAKGTSVRACVQKMAGGDRSLALRYQNKYRSILRQRPESIEQVIEELREEGVVCPSPYDAQRMRRTQAQPLIGGGQSIAELLGALRQMLDWEDTRSEMRHREEMDRMGVRCDLLRLELARREEMLIEEKGRRAEAVAAAWALCEACGELLSAQDVKLAKKTRTALEKGVAQVSAALEAEHGEQIESPQEEANQA